MSYTPREIYEGFLIRVNKNDTNANVSIPVSQFVMIFNNQKRQWLDDKIKGKEGNDFIEDLSSLLMTDVTLERISAGTNKDTFRLPSDFFRRVRCVSVASNGVCTGSVIVNWFVKPKDVNVRLTNEDLKPSFDYQESICVLTSEGIDVYKDGFTISKALLTYYREPKDLDISGYVKIDGTQSKDIAVDLDKFSIDEILDRTALEAVRNYYDAAGVQLGQARVQTSEGTVN